MTTTLVAATEAALRCLAQRDRGKHQLPLSEIHRVWVSEYALNDAAAAKLGAALEHAAAARTHRKAA